MRIQILILGFKGLKFEFYSILIQKILSGQSNKKRKKIRYNMAFEQALCLKKG